MPLTWSLEKVENCEEVCFVPASADDPINDVKEGDRILSPLTNALILSTVTVGLGEITEQNASEFFARLSMLESLDGPMLRRRQKDGSMKEVPFSPAEIRAHIGLRCNVTSQTRRKWLGGIGRDLDLRRDRYDRAVRTGQGDG